MKFQLNPTYSFVDVVWKDGCHGGHLGYQNKMILAVLNLHVASMPPTNFQLNPTYHSGAAVVDIFKMAAMVTSLDIKIEWPKQL